MNSRKKLARFLRWSEPLVDGTTVLASIVVLASYCTLDVLRPSPATGGDMGSHFWPLVTLVEQALPNFSLRSWNPGNLGGEPHLVHYFPGPYLVMALLSTMMPLGMAFNVGTVLAVVCLPLCAYVALRGLGAKFPAPALAAVFSLGFLLNEGYSMWGGNLLSTLAGQFAHGYALDFLLLGIGSFGSEVRRGKFPIWSSVAFSLVAISHSYVLLSLPVFFLSFAFCYRYSTTLSRIKRFVASGIITLLLSVWFLIPLVTNAPWTTPFSMKWVSKNLLRETVSSIFDPLLGALAVALVVTLLLPRTRKSTCWLVLFWAVPIVANIGYYFVFPALGLVDVRAFPQALLFGVLLTASLSGALLRDANRVLAWYAPLLLLVVFSWHLSQTVKTAPIWFAWNYSGWESKPLSYNASELAKSVQGDFSKPRLAYEHSEISRAAGTERVFEMLPYFARRATLESVYMQADLLALPIYHLQSEISKTPSCPFPELHCGKPNLESARFHMQLLGVGSLILITDELLEQARSRTWLKEKGKFGPWVVFDLNPQPDLVEVLRERPVLVDDPDWKSHSYDWFRSRQEPGEVLISKRNLTREQEKGLFQATQAIDNAGLDILSRCKAQVAPDFRGLTLTTNCPGFLHLLKFAYHPTFRTSTNDPIYLATPGMMALVPSTTTVRLDFGASLLWRAAGAVSACAWAALLAFGVVMRARSSPIKGIIPSAV